MRTPGAEKRVKMFAWKTKLREEEKIIGREEDSQNQKENSGEFLLST